MKNALSKAFPATAAVVALLSGQAHAQDDSGSTVINVFWITETTLSLNSINQYPLAASIVTADSSSTVVAVECAGPSIDTSVCGTEAQTITYGSTTWVASETTGNLGVTMQCSIAQNSESAVCTGEIDAPEQIINDPLINSSEASELLTATTVDVLSTAYSGTLSSTDFTFLPITVTAGQEKLAGGSRAADSSSSSSSSGADGNANANGAGSFKSNLGLSGWMAGFLGLVMMVL
ncbi:hypothetical protein A1O7_07558 [Cladophialophora yegresii CBS 114405]|uniref:Ig-like domain-containing protein n=1 Tax=Cladophialophora yegresii CBS 114405 TaxID=1182544 RepID=W9VY92_9EURO|nr:uncharacterized protein A1O7_07558 [Cladophialophora yegresii CBS 114405]EXJ57211.1 hypothetical protein A1O7_07558 [Cladophialophora yegresii CBS 114405]